MPRVAVVSTSYPTSAGDPAGHFVAAEARSLARSADVVVVTAAAGAGSPAQSVEQGILVHRLDGGDAFGWPGVAARVKERPLRLLSFLAWARRARGLLAALPPFDRVIAHWAVPSGFPIALAASGDPRIELVSHGADVRVLLRLPAVARHAVVGRLLDRASTWRFVSEALRDQLAAALSPRHASRLATIASVAPAAIELPDVRARSRVLRGDADGERLFVLVGRLVPGKRFHRSLERAAREPGRGTRVVVVGDGPERESLEAHARALSLDALFVGKTTREDALAWIGAADTLLHASRAEGLSTVVREAEALGVPVEVVP